MKTFKISPFICFLIVIMGFFVWAMLPKEDQLKKMVAQVERDKNKADLSFKDATLAEMSNGIKYWELVAKTSTLNKNKGTSILNQVDGLFFDNGKPSLKFIAPRARWNMGKNEIYLKDPVGFDVKYEKLLRKALINGNSLSKYSVFNLTGKRPGSFEGYWFQAKNLEWKLATKKLICNGDISLTKGNIIINSDKLEADVGMDNVTLSGHPVATISSEGRTIEMKAETFIINSSKESVYANNNVTLINGKSRITAQHVVLDQKNNIMLLSEDVNIFDGEIKAHSKSAIYNITKKMITLIDKAKAIRGSNELYGDKIYVFLGQSKIIVEGKAKTKVKEAEIK